MARESRPAERPERDVDDGAELRYQVRVAPDLARLDVEVCTSRPDFMRFRPGRDDAGQRLRRARSSTPGPARRLYPDAQGVLVLAPGRGERCLGYAIALTDGGALSSLVRHAGDAVIASVNAWLYRPELRPSDMRARLELALPAGMEAVLPYPRDEHGAYLLDAAAFRFDGYAAFGRLARQRVHHGTGTLEVVAFEGAPTAATLAAWTRAQLAEISPLGLEPGALPGSVFVLDAPPAAEPFGSVTRSGQGSVLALLPRGIEPGALAAHWMLRHELSHFALPFVRREDAWLPEGFATYFQEVLPGRAGTRSQRAVIAALYDTLTRVEEESRGLALAEESAEMLRRARYRTVYWGGAALCLAMDVALLQASGARLGLSELAARLRARDGERSAWTSETVLDAIDAELGSPLVKPLVARELARPFPDFRATFAALGVVDGEARTGDDATRALRERVFGAE